MTWIVGGVELPGDLEWIDEMAPTRLQIESPSLAGGTLIQRSRRQSGTPVTLQTPRGVFLTRQQILDLNALLEDDETDAFTVIHPDGRELQCRFRYGNGLPVDWANTYFRSPPLPTDGWHTLTLRLMTA